MIVVSSLALHSGDYVARYNRKSLARVRGLLRYMDVADDSEIADYACGNGMLLQVLGERAGAYHGVDFSPEFISSAEAWAERSRLGNCRFHCDDIVSFARRHAGRFDRAATLDFSEHVEDEEAVPIYAAIRSSLKPGGKLYLHTPNLDFIIERLKQRGIMRQFPEHVAVRNGEQTAAMLVKAGFAADRIRIRYIPHYNVMKLLHPLSLLPGIGKFFRARIWIEAEA
jgi:2-polyprenyl-3-methyl-5-hydroxy-6-metoxy-1,4-benzoquinol methylase